MGYMVVAKDLTEQIISEWLDSDPEVQNAFLRMMRALVTSKKSEQVHDSLVQHPLKVE